MADRNEESGIAVNQDKKVDKQLKRARRKIKWLQKELAKAKEANAMLASVPPPAPYECSPEDLVWVGVRDLKNLVHLACQVNQDYAVPWFQRVVAANAPTLDNNLQIILQAIPALKKLLDFPGPLPPPGIRQILEKERCIRAA